MPPSSPRVAAVLLVLAAAACAAAPRPTGHRVARTRDLMGTEVTIVAWSTDETRASRAIERAFDEIARLERLMSPRRDESDLSRVNAAAGSGRPVAVAAEVVAVIREALAVARLSGGAFDPTVGAFAGLWRFDSDRDGTIPEPALVEARRLLVDYRDVIVDEAASTVALRRAGQRLTLGGIAKGYAVDRAVATLRAHGVRDALVQAGGDLYAAGRPGDRPWIVGIRDPRGGPEDAFATVELEDRTFSTSGDYERFVLVGARRYHHILDPSTGYPAMRCRSVTALARDALRADGLSTALFVLGPERGLALVESLPDVEAVFVDDRGRVTVSSGLRASPGFRLLGAPRRDGAPGDPARHGVGVGGNG